MKKPDNSKKSGSTKPSDDKTKKSGNAGEQAKTAAPEDKTRHAATKKKPVTIDLEAKPVEKSEAKVVPAKSAVPKSGIKRVSPTKA